MGLERPRLAFEGLRPSSASSSSLLEGGRLGSGGDADPEDAGAPVTGECARAFEPEGKAAWRAATSARTLRTRSARVVVDLRRGTSRSRCSPSGSTQRTSARVAFRDPDELLQGPS
ncbi:MAG: hypothetical protein M0C28_23740 [Candidatus Moduliflexus flocculans]|nr:hypothetical protein [Candidatus Moduliflexus flocculans]